MAREKEANARMIEAVAIKLKAKKEVSLDSGRSTGTLIPGPESQVRRR
jgi:hypothetical protein